MSDDPIDRLIALVGADDPDAGWELWELVTRHDRLDVLARMLRVLPAARLQDGLPDVLQVLRILDAASPEHRAPVFEAMLARRSDLGGAWILYRPTPALDEMVRDGLRSADPVDREHAVAATIERDDPELMKEAWVTAREESGRLAWWLVARGERWALAAALLDPADPRHEPAVVELAADDVDDALSARARARLRACATDPALAPGDRMRWSGFLRGAERCAVLTALAIDGHLPAWEALEGLRPRGDALQAMRQLEREAQTEALRERARAGRERLTQELVASIPHLRALLAQILPDAE